MQSLPDHPAKRNISVVLDTNIIFTKDSYFLNKTIAQIIEESANYPFLEMTWYLPKLALLERLNQMRERASKVFGYVKEASTILNTDLGVTLEQLQQAAEHTAEAELKRLAIRILPTDWRSINWDSLIEDAALRRPPFSPGNSEKGFRDAIIVESYLQLIASLSASGSNHRALLVTSDELMIQAVKDRVRNDARSYSPSTLDGLRTIIATLLSELEEKLVNRLLPKATAFFYSPGSQTSLYYLESIPGLIDAKFSSTFQGLPPGGADFRTTSAPSIISSRFVRKDGQRFFWANRIVFISVAYRYSPSGSPGGYAFHSSQPSSLTSPSATSSGSVLGISGAFQAPLAPTGFSFQGASSIYVPPYPTGLSQSSSPLPVAFSTGSTTFEVIWSAEVSTQETFTSAKLEDLAYRGTDWS